MPSSSKSRQPRCVDIHLRLDLTTAGNVHEPRLRSLVAAVVDGAEMAMDGRQPAGHCGRRVGLVLWALDQGHLLSSGGDGRGDCRLACRLSACRASFVVG